MGGHAYRHISAVQNVSIKYQQDAWLLRDQCEIFQNALPVLNENGPWYHIFKEHIRRLEQEQIPLLESRSLNIRALGSELETLAYDANALGKSLIIDLKYGYYAFV
jgi:hypothetical protein